MYISADLLDSNAVGVIGAALVTAFFGLLSTVTVIVVGRRNRSDTKGLQDVVQQASDNAEQAVTNTHSVSNGFAGRMDSKLDAITASQQNLQNAFREHLAWHLNKETPK
jgi:hypothetical protein